ncbi:TolC family protein [Herbaspirillum sp. HC18]|nr:TolC family protein [Herbaspirillum sp. HC18]
MNRLLLTSMLALIGVAHAVEPVTPPGLLPTPIARALLEQDPRVAAARAGLEVARHDAAILDQSPHEWTAKVAGQRRALESGPRYREWNAGIERTIRLPGKAAADRDLGKATVEESEARYGEAVYEAAKELLTLWVDWLAAERSRELAAITLQSAQEGLAAVETRVRAGDASKLDLSIARAELAEHRRMDSDAKAHAAATWSRLSVRFPGVPRQVVALPSPMPIGEDEAFWRERILAESDDLKLVRTQLRQAQVHAARARAEKTPDPTLGIYTASEVGGQERISGITLSIPIPGGARELRSAKASAAVAVSHQEVGLKKRQLEAEIAGAVAIARGAYDSLQVASEGASAAQENAALMQRAYTLGEAELQALLLANRQATTASGNALQAQATASKSYYGLLVDAHLIWDLKHD